MSSISRSFNSIWRLRAANCLTASARVQNSKQQRIATTPHLSVTAGTRHVAKAVFILVLLSTDFGALYDIFLTGTGSSAMLHSLKKLFSPSHMKQYYICNLRIAVLLLLSAVSFTFFWTINSVHRLSKYLLMSHSIHHISYLLSQLFTALEIDIRVIFFFCCVQPSINKD